MARSYALAIEKGKTMATVTPEKLLEVTMYLTNAILATNPGDRASLCSDAMRASIELVERENNDA